MECPKCGIEISNNTLVCPNCKKVLKTVCPKCKTINSGNVCKKCGSVLVTKCAKCGKINLLRNENCVKCGHSNELSVIINESNTDDFAVVRIDFPNSDVIKARLTSNKLYEKFRQRLDNMIVTCMAKYNARRQIVGKDTYIIRFNRDYTFSASAKSAISAICDLAVILSKLNLKTLKKKGFMLKCNFTIMHRSVKDNPYAVESLFKANILKQSTELDTQILDAFQVITDDTFYDFYSNDYKLETLDAVLVGNKMVQVYELDITNSINVNELLQEQALLDERDKSYNDMPEFVHQNIEEQEKLSLELLNKNKDDVNVITEIIKFEQITAEFITSDGVDVVDDIVKVFQNKPKSIVSIKGSNDYQPYTLKVLAAMSNSGLYSNIIPVTCSDEMKYAPYAFFKLLIETVFDFTISQKMLDKNDFTIFENIDKFGLIKDLEMLNQRDMSDLMQNRENYCQAFIAMLRVIPKTLIYIENFEKIDKSSMFLLEQMFYYFDELQISYLISHDKTFTLHRNINFLLTKDYYTEIRILPTPYKKIIGESPEFYANILEDFYFQRIIKYAFGSVLFIDYAIQYLIESGVYQYTDTSVIMVNPKTIMIPSSLEKLIERRLNLLKDNHDQLMLLSTLILLGVRVDKQTINSLEIPNWQNLASELANQGYMFNFNDSVYFPNYNIVKDSLLKILKPFELDEIVNRINEKVYSSNIPNPEKIFMAELTNKSCEQIISQWESLANINISMGDYSSYLNCSNQILNCLDKFAHDWSMEQIEQYKLALFVNVSDNMYEYDPKVSKELVEQAVPILKSMEDTSKYYTLISKVLQGDIENGNFINALNNTHEMLSSLSHCSLDPSAENFDFQYLFMTLIYIRILFNLGEFNDCLDLGYNILNVLDSQKIANMNYTTVSKEDFEYVLVEAIGYIAVSIIFTMCGNVDEFLQRVRTLIDIIPKSYDILIQLQNLIMGHDVEVDGDIVNDNNPMSIIIYHILNAFVCGDSPEHFAQEIYNAKLLAKDSMLLQFEIFADLMIGYAYINLGANERANAVLNRIIKYAQEKGMVVMVYVAWYVLSILNMVEGKLDIAFGILNNSNIQMEKTSTISEYLLLLNKINIYKILKSVGQEEDASICLNQAKDIITKHNINFRIEEE